MIVSIILSNRDVTLELPFTLSHPKPAEETPPPTPVQSAPSEEAAPGKYNIRRDGREKYFPLPSPTPLQYPVAHMEEGSG